MDHKRVTNHGAELSISKADGVIGKGNVSDAMGLRNQVGQVAEMTFRVMLSTVVGVVRIVMLADSLAAAFAGRREFVEVKSIESCSRKAGDGTSDEHGTVSLRGCCNSQLDMD